MDIGPARAGAPLELWMIAGFSLLASFGLCLVAVHSVTGHAGPWAIAALVCLALVTLSADIASAVLLSRARDISAQPARAWTLRAVFLVIAACVGILEHEGAHVLGTQFQHDARAELAAREATAAARADLAAASLRRAQDGEAAALAPYSAQLVQIGAATADQRRERAALEAERNRARDHAAANVATVAAQNEAAARELAAARAASSHGPRALPDWIWWAVPILLGILKGPIIWLGSEGPKPQVAARTLGAADHIEALRAMVRAGTGAADIAAACRSIATEAQHRAKVA